MDVGYVEKTCQLIREIRDEINTEAWHHSMQLSDKPLNHPNRQHDLRVQCANLAMYLAVHHWTELIVALRTYQKGLDQEIPF